MFLQGKPEFQRSGHADKRPSQDGDGAGAEKACVWSRQASTMRCRRNFFSIDLMDAYEHLGTILGESLEEDLVNEIFSHFCMGK